VTIFNFDSKQHNGNLEDTILEALINGKYSLMNIFSFLKNSFYFLAAKFSGEHNEQYRRIAELKLAMVILKK